MPRPRRRHMLVAAPFLLVACSGDHRQPGAISTDEARQVNAAAEMLATDSVALNAVANDQDMP